MISRDPLWFKDAVIYEVHIKTFCDSNGDGIGDIRGLLSKLDYLVDLGVTAIWLLPFYPSPLRDDGYDIADYFSVNPTYGTLADLEELLAEAHRRGLRVITELVLNHTSDQNAWFQKSRRAKPGEPFRDYYVWSDTADRYPEARIIFKDFETSNWSWDPVAKAYFWHRFYSHQPDLNYDNPAVHAAAFAVIDFWMEKGVDGLRLDAVPYLYEREGTNCENLPETYAFLRKLRTHLDSKFEDRLLLAEANQWPEDAAAYFGQGDTCQMNFHFPLMPRMFMSIQMEDRFPLVDILEQTPAIPDNCQWAIFLRNHDELTLEMVTDEERDYMYRVYASDTRARINLGIRRRLAPLLGNSRRKIELINILLFSLPGTPIIYYGDEIGMGDNFYLGDRDGVRTPMQWTPDRNAGFSKANPQQLYLPAIIDPEYHYEALNVENQEKNLSSLLWWMRRVVSMRKQHAAFGRGTIEFLHPDNGKVLAFIRRYEAEIILVVVNLSRFVQVAEIDLAAFAGMRPVELFSQNKFPLVGATPTVFTLGPHGHYWLQLEVETEAATSLEYTAPQFTRRLVWDQVLAGAENSFLERAVLPAYLRAARWFGGKARAIRDFTIVQNIALPAGPGPAACLLEVRANYLDAPLETYLLPLQLGVPDLPGGALAVVARFGEQALFDAVHDENFRAGLLRLMIEGQPVKTAVGELRGFAGAALEPYAGTTAPLASQVLKVEQSNSSIVYENKLFLKLYRKLEDGVNPDAELTRYLSEKQHFSQVPLFGGSIEFRPRTGEPRVLGLLLGMVANVGDAWVYTLDAVGRFYERVLAEKPDVPRWAASPFTPPNSEPNSGDVAEDLVGGVYPERVRQLGHLTAAMHRALAAETLDANFAPEPFTAHFQRSLYQSMRGSVRKMMDLLQRSLRVVPEPAQADALDLLASEKPILDRQARLLRNKMVASKIRIHGDYHLGQVLNTGKDFVVIDFEGEPSRSLGERKLKRAALRDVAGMLRSFHYAAYTALSQRVTVRAEDAQVLQPWAEFWAARVSRIYLSAYLEAAAGASFLPDKTEDAQVLLEALMLEKAVYEVGYELNNRPSWVGIPIRGIRDILAAG